MNTSAVRSSSPVFICSAVIPRVPAQITASFIPAIARLSLVGCFLADGIGLGKRLSRDLLSWGARRRRPALGWGLCHSFWPLGRAIPFPGCSPEMRDRIQPWGRDAGVSDTAGFAPGIWGGGVLQCQVLPESILNHIALPCKYRSGKGTDFSLFFW